MQAVPGRAQETQRSNSVPPMAEGRPRVAPGGRRQIGLVNAGIARAAGVRLRTGPPNIFTTLGRHRGLFRRWLVFASALMPGGKLPRDETELLILRVAHNTGCEYEWSHHARIGRAAGLTEEEVARVREGPEAKGWSPRRALLLRAADELHAEGRIGDELWAELAAVYEPRLLIEVCMLVGHYEMLAMTLNSLGVQPERPARS
jgi:AhpD family alkylhydroperoxidase